MASFFEDLLGNAAISGGALLQDHINQQRKQDDERRQQEMYIERQRAIDEQRMALEERKRQELQARTGEQMLKVDQLAPAVTTARQLAEGQTLAPSLDATALDIVKQHLSPEELKSTYGINDNVFTRIDDKLTAARKGGLYEAADQLEKQRKDTIEMVKMMRQDKLTEAQIDYYGAGSEKRRADAAAKPGETEAKLIGAKAALERAQNRVYSTGGAGSGAGKSFKVQELADGRLVRITRDSVEDLGMTGVTAQKLIDSKVNILLKDDIKVGGKRFSQLTPEEQYDHASQLVLQGPRKPGAPLAPVGGAPAAMPTPTAKPAPGGAGWGMRRLDGGK